jgi:hypothetical protein
VLEKEIHVVETIFLLWVDVARLMELVALRVFIA